MTNSVAGVVGPRPPSVAPEVVTEGGRRFIEPADTIRLDVGGALVNPDQVVTL